MCIYKTDIFIYIANIFSKCIPNGDFKRMEIVMLMFNLLHFL